MELRESTYYVMAALLDGPLHGYAIVKAATELSDGRVRLSAGTLYGSLARLEAERLVSEDGEEVVAGRRRRYFRLTPEGRAALVAEAERLHARATLVRDRIGHPGPARVAGVVA